MSRVIIPQAGGTPMATSGRLSIATGQMVSLVPQQIIGLMPLTECLNVHCRSYFGDCYQTPVFGDTGASGSTYENDINSFYLNDGLLRTIRYQLYRINERLHTIELVNGNMNSDYGTIKPYGSFPTHPTYAGIFLNWGAVLALHGPGLYAIALTSVGTAPDQANRFPFCLASEPFRLLPFNCDLAENTVKFEALNSGMMGSISTPGVVFNLCGMQIFDSIRFKGFFGNEKTGYLTEELEYQNGLIDLINDEAQQRNELKTRLLPKWLHDRLKVYGLLADRTYVSDYNWSNSDHNIKRKLVRKNAGYEPKWNERNRQASVQIEFVDGVQSVIKSISCP